MLLVNYIYSVIYNMVIHNVIKFSLVLTSLLFSACGSIEQKTEQIGNKVKSIGANLLDTTINKLSSPDVPDSFSIRNIVKDFVADTTIKELKGIQVDNNSIYTEYCVYRGQKDRVLNGINKIVPKSSADYSSDKNCYPVSKQSFYKNIIADERNISTSFFWQFEQSKDFEIYTCIKAPLRHYIIFDQNSDTVYHRIEELLN